MKALLRLTLAVCLLAGVVALPSTAEESAALKAAKPTQCEQYCWAVRCIPGYVCGPYTDANGQPACGCHVSPIKEPV